MATSLPTDKCIADDYRKWKPQSPKKEGIVDTRTGKVLATEKEIINLIENYESKKEENGLREILRNLHWTSHCPENCEDCNEFEKITEALSEINKIIHDKEVEYANKYYKAMVETVEEEKRKYWESVEKMIDELDIRWSLAKDLKGIIENIKEELKSKLGGLEWKHLK
jgi:RecA-family ATPase